MSADEIKQQAAELPIAPGTRYAVLQRLVLDGVLDSPVSSEEIVTNVNEALGLVWKTRHIQPYMKKFMSAGIVRAVKRKGSHQSFWVLASVSRAEALARIGKGAKTKEIEDELFSNQLLARLRHSFAHEFDELHDNFGRHGNCTAFLLRKILEKLIIIAFSKSGKQHLLEDQSRPGGWKGLADLVETAAREKHNGLPFLVPKTANEIKGLKFLGDTAAHNPLVGVDMQTILPQMPYIITAYEELSRFF